MSLNFELDWNIFKVLGPKAPKPNGAEGPIMPSAGARYRGAKRPRYLVYIYIYICIYIYIYK